MRSDSECFACLTREACAVYCYCDYCVSCAQLFESNQLSCPSQSLQYAWCRAFCLLCYLACLFQLLLRLFTISPGQWTATTSLLRQVSWSSWVTTVQQIDRRRSDLCGLLSSHTHQIAVACCFLKSPSSFAVHRSAFLWCWFRWFLIGVFGTHSFHNASLAYCCLLETSLVVSLLLCLFSHTHLASW